MQKPRLHESVAILCIVVGGPLFVAVALTADHNVLQAKIDLLKSDREMLRWAVSEQIRENDELRLENEQLLQVIRDASRDAGVLKDGIDKIAVDLEQIK